MVFVGAATYVSHNLLGIALQDIALYGIAIFLAVYNVTVLFLLNHFAKRGNVVLHSAVKKIINIQISADLLILTVLLHFSGGIENPFVFYFIFHMIIASILLSVWESFLQATFAVLLFCLLILLEYLQLIPHYSVDTKTKKVVNQSEKPINPAVKLAIDDGERTFERWLWAKFPSSLHKETKLSLPMRFTDFDLGGTKGKYILVAAGENKQWLLLSNNRRKRAEEVVLGRFYPFADKEYSFVIEKIMDEAIIKTEWRNNSERLLRPAIIATIEQNGCEPEELGIRRSGY